MKEYLPLGSVVMLKGAKKKVVIYGRMQIAKESQKMYDYLGCVYPQGYFKSDMQLCFNAEQIEQVVHIGYADEEEKAHLDKMVPLVQAYILSQKEEKKES